MWALAFLPSAIWYHQPAPDARAGLDSMSGVPPETLTSSGTQPTATNVVEAHDALAGNAPVYRGSIALYRPVSDRPSCEGTVPVPGRYAAISGALSAALDPACQGPASNCAWCNRDALVTGPGGSAVIRIIDKVLRTLMRFSSYTCLPAVARMGTLREGMDRRDEKP